MKTQVHDTAQDLLELLVDLTLEDQPEIAALLEGIINLVWDSDSEDMSEDFANLWTELQVYVQQQIVASEIAELKTQISAFTQIMAQYVGAQSPGERSGYMINMVSQALILQNELTDVAGNSNCIQFIPLAASFIPLHMATLKEQYLHGAEIYGSAVDQDQWKKQLIEAHDTYLNYFVNHYDALKKWRINQVTSNLPDSELVNAEIDTTVKDLFTGDSQTFETSRASKQPDLFAGYFGDIQDYIVSSWEVHINDQLRPYYWIDSFLPDNLDAKRGVLKLPLDELGKLKIGPINAITFFFGRMDKVLTFGQLIEYQKETKDVNDEQEPITEILLLKDSDYNLTGMTVSYESFEGSLIGTQNVNSNEIKFDQAQLRGMQIAFFGYESNGAGGNEIDKPQITDFSFTFSDGNVWNPLNPDDTLSVTSPKMYDLSLINGASSNFDSLIDELSIGFSFNLDDQSRGTTTG